MFRYAKTCVSLSYIVHVDCSGLSTVTKKIIIIIFLTLGTYDPEGDEKLRKWIYKLGYDHQSVRSVVGKLSC